MGIRVEFSSMAFPWVRVGIVDFLFPLGENVVVCMALSDDIAACCHDRGTFWGLLSASLGEEWDTREEDALGS